jgi:LL-diaminopimelate aminotransferase
VLPLLGSKEGIFHLPLAVIDPGDVVLVPNPGYGTYTQGARFAGGEPYDLPLLPERDFLPDLDSIPENILKRARLLWLNYPGNPTAATAPLEFFAEVVAFARQHDLLVCHDAAYSQVSFDGFHPPSLLQAPGAKEVAVEFNTLSKSHNMAGWRVGAAVGQPEVLRSLYNLKTNADSGHFLPVLAAATAAMTGDQTWLQERNLVYQERRDRVMQALRELGWQAATPRASLYVWFHVPQGWDSAGFATAALERSHISLTPGTVFGKHGEGYIRLSLTASTERVSEAMDRLVKVWG